MNRLQKKCFIVSTGIHLSLALLLVLGPAFMASSRRRDDVQVLTYFPSMSVDANVSSQGGGPNSQPTQAPTPPTVPVASPTPTVTPAPPPARDVKPPKDTAATPAADRHVVVPSFKPVRNPNATTRKPPQPSDTTADSRQRIADQLHQSTSAIRNGISSTTSIEVRAGSGSGGPSYASFAQTVLAYYDQAWMAPDGMDTSEAVVGVRVTVEPDGRVSSAKIIDRSGDPRVDRSVQDTLDRVSYIPVPAGSTSSRTVEFNFRSRNKPNL